MRKSDQVLPVDFVCSDADFHRTAYYLTIPRKFTYEDCLDPEFWRLQSRIRAGDEVTVVGEDGSYDCTLRCTAAGERGGFAIMRELRAWFQPKAAAQSETTGRAHTGFVPAEGAWLLFNSAGTPVAKYASEDSSNTALLDFITANPHEAGQVAA